MCCQGQIQTQPEPRKKLPARIVTAKKIANMVNSAIESSILERPAGVAVHIGQQRQPDEGEARQEYTGDGRREVVQLLLQAQEIPRRLAGFGVRFGFSCSRRGASIAMLATVSITVIIIADMNSRHQQMRPDEHGVFELLLDPCDGLLLDHRQRAIPLLRCRRSRLCCRHGISLVVSLRHAGRLAIRPASPFT